MGQPMKNLRNLKLMKIFQIIYYIFIVLIVSTAFLLIASTFPITGNYKIMIVHSGSMEPAIKMGGIVIVGPTNDYKIGDVISFGEISRTEMSITHRIYDIKVTEGRVSYITKGDHNNGPDQREVFEKEIIGKVLLSVPYLGYGVNFAKKPLGFGLIIIVPAVIIIFDEAKKIFQEVKKKEKGEVSN